MQAAGTGHPIDLDLIRRSWSMVLEEVRKQSKRVHAFVANTSPTAFDGSTLTIETQSTWHAEQLGDAKNVSILSTALTTIIGSAPRLAAKAAPKRKEEPDDIDDARDAEPAGDAKDVLKAAFGDVSEVE